MLVRYNCCIYCCFFSKDFDSTLSEIISLLNTRNTSKTVKPKKKTWCQRMEIEDKKWNEKREELINYTKATYSLSKLCQVCREKQPILKCMECSKGYCSFCDLNVHEDLPFHNRSSFESGYFEPLLPTECFNDEGALTNVGKNYLKLNFRCLI